MDPIRNRISFVCSRDCKLSRCGLRWVHPRHERLASGGVFVRISARNLAIILLIVILVHPLKRKDSLKACSKRAHHNKEHFGFGFLMYPNPKLPNSHGLPVRSSTRGLAYIFSRYIS